MKLYLAAMNDGLFIIDQPPRPAPNDEGPADTMPDAKVVAKIVGASREDQAIAQCMVDAYNAYIGAST